MKCGEHVVLVGQDHSFDLLNDMQDLNSGLVLECSSTQEGLPAVFVQVGSNVCLYSAGSVTMIITPFLDRPSHALGKG